MRPLSAEFRKHIRIKQVHELITQYPVNRGLQLKVLLAAENRSEAFQLIEALSESVWQVFEYDANPQSVQSRQLRALRLSGLEGHYFVLLQEPHQDALRRP